MRVIFEFLKNRPNMPNNKMGVDIKGFIENINIEQIK